MKLHNENIRCSRRVLGLNRMMNMNISITKKSIEWIGHIILPPAIAAEIKTVTALSMAHGHETTQVSIFDFHAVGCRLTRLIRDFLVDSISTPKC